MAVRAAFCFIQNIFFLSISSPHLWGQLLLHLNVCVFVRMHVRAGWTAFALLAWKFPACHMHYGLQHRSCLQADRFPSCISSLSRTPDSTAERSDSRRSCMSPHLSSANQRYRSSGKGLYWQLWETLRKIQQSLKEQVTKNLRAFSVGCVTCAPWLQLWTHA